MNTEIIAIGEELLQGTIINSNAAFISEQLLQCGCKVNRHITLPDDEETLQKGIEEALKRAELVITSGGLGPTCDDITRKVIAKVMGCSLEYNEAVAESLKKRFGEKKLTSLEDQATIPAKAMPFFSRVGTAPGLLFKREEGGLLVVLPGVPEEMRQIVIGDLLPYLRQNLPQKKRLFSKWLHLFREIESNVDPSLRKIQKEYPKVEVGVYPHQGTLSIRVSVAAESKEEGEALLEKPYQFLEEKFEGKIFSRESAKIEEAIHNAFIEKKLTLSTAESCTGGAIAGQLTALPGASKYFLGGIIAYSNFLKENLLSVSKETLEKFGAVSEEVVQEMAEGVMATTKSDYSIAVSGIAGPEGGSKEKPVGTIAIAIGKKGEKTKTHIFQAYGNREANIKRATNIALSELWNNLLINN